MRVFLDIDEVCANLLSGLEGFYPQFNANAQNVYSLPDYIDFNILWKIPQFWLDLPVLDRPTITIAGYVSHRPFPVWITEEWLERNELPQQPVYHVNSSADKAELLQKLDCHLFVDDKPETVLMCREYGLNAVLYDQLWNRSYNINRIYCLKDLEDLCSEN